MNSTTTQCSTQPEEHGVITPLNNMIITDVTNGETNYETELNQEVPVFLLIT